MALTPQQQAEVAALVAAHAAAYERLEQNTVDSVQAIINRLVRLWFTDGAVKPVVREAVEFVRDAQEAVADLTAEYLDNVFETLDISVPREVRAQPVRLPNRLRGVDALLEWERPPRDARVVRLLGADEFEAAEKARVRAEQQARMDLMLARRESERQRWGLSEDITGYRRILRPELSKYGPCGLCIVAADRIYSKAELRPLHNGCVCDVLPVTESLDPGITLNREDLDKLYDAAGGTGRRGLQRVRVQILEHGELGPILVDGRNRNRDSSRTKSLADQGLDPMKVFTIQSDLVRKYRADIAAGKKVPAATLDFHRRLAKEWAAKANVRWDDDLAA